MHHTLLLLLDGGSHHLHKVGRRSLVGSVGMEVLAWTHTCGIQDRARVSAVG